MPAQPMLTGVRVIDLSQYIPGPFATRQLADLGADVIKIEPPGGDPMRRFMAAGEDECSPIYCHVNRGKRVCRLDLKSETGKQALEALIAGADILLESFRPGVLARLGFTREHITGLNPHLIHCALSGYGQDGPYAQRAGHDINYCAITGQGLVSGTADSPVIGYPPIADHAGAMQAAVAMLAALHGRRNRQAGIFLDISIAESILSWQYLPLLGNARERAESVLNGGAACYNIYRCADGGFVSLGAIETRFWANFCAAVDKPDWVGRQFESMPQHHLVAEVAAVIMARSRDDWQRRFTDLDCCFEILNTPDVMGSHPQMAYRRALNDNGPRHPAWIDGHPVSGGEAPEMIESTPGPRWLSPSRQ